MTAIPATTTTSATSAPVTAPTTRAAILLAETAATPVARKRLDSLASTVESLAQITVLPAYLTPGRAADALSLGAAAERLIAGGAQEIVVLPYLVDWSYPTLYDGPDLLYDLAEDHPAIHFRLGRPLSNADGVATLLDQHVTEAWDFPDAATATVRHVADVAGQTPITTAILSEGDLPHLPAHAQHLLVCFGRRCMEQGSPDAYRLLTSTLTALGLDSGPDRVKVSRTKCLSPCAAAPVACLYPKGDFVARLDAATVPSFIEETLVAGRPLPGHTFQAG